MTHMTKLTRAFRNLTSAPKNRRLSITEIHYCTYYRKLITKLSVVTVKAGLLSIPIKFHTTFRHRQLHMRNKLLGIIWLWTIRSDT